jgi:hypothetical protein
MKIGQITAIGKNLAEAIYAIRMIGVIVPVWIALSINQVGLTERTQQVLGIGEMYDITILVFFQVGKLTTVTD